MEILIINGHDYSRFIESKGYGWSREDLDSENTVRTRDGLLRRDKIGVKRKLSFRLMNMTRAQLAQLDRDLSQASFSASYMDLHGTMTRSFYCSSFSVTLETAPEGADDAWGEAAFNMIEV